MHQIALAVGSLLTLGFMGLTVLIFRNVWRSDSGLRRGMINLSTLAFSTLFVLIALESYFFAFVEPDGWAFTLASKRWNVLYDGPFNSLGYRDTDKTAEDFTHKKGLVVVGDSFAHGCGIRDYRNRFSEVLARDLGDGWVVATLGRRGWNTTHELKALQEYPFQPQYVILQYYTNDIKHAAEKNGITVTPEIPWPTGYMKTVISHSYLADFVYWRLMRWHLQDFLGDFQERCLACYTNEAVWRDHEKELRGLAQYVQEHHAHLLTVIFPNLFQVERDRPNTAKVAAVFESMGVPVLDLTPTALGRNPKSMVCNAFNAHPNEAFSKEVGDLITRKWNPWNGFDMKIAGYPKSAPRS